MMKEYKGADGKTVIIANMDDSHLSNAINLFTKFEKITREDNNTGYAPNAYWRNLLRALHFESRRRVVKAEEEYRIECRKERFDKILI